MRVIAYDKKRKTYYSRELKPAPQRVHTVARPGRKDVKRPKGRRS